MSSIDSVTGINNADFSEYPVIAERNGAPNKDAGFADVLIDALTREDEGKSTGSDNISGVNMTGDNIGKPEFPSIPGFPGGYGYHQFVGEAQTDKPVGSDTTAQTGEETVYNTDTTAQTGEALQGDYKVAGDDVKDNRYDPENDNLNGLEDLPGYDYKQRTDTTGTEYSGTYEDGLTPGIDLSFEYCDTDFSYNSPGSNIDFSGMISEALREEISRMGAAAASGYTGMPGAQMPMMQGTGIEQMILTAASTGQVDDAQIALFMLCMMMQSNQDSDFSMLMQMMAMMLTQIQGDTGGMRNNIMSSGYDQSVLGAIDRNVFSARIPERSGTGQAIIPVDGWVPTSPAIISTAAYRNPQLYSAVVNQFRVETSERYQSRDGKTYCNIFVWDVTSAMGAEIPYRTDSVTGRPWPEDTSNAISMSATRMDTWLETFGRQYGWTEVDASTAQWYANQGMPAVTTAGSIGHVQMVVPSRDGQFDETRGVTIAQAGGPLTSYRYITSTYSSSALRDHVRYWVHS